MEAGDGLIISRHPRLTTTVRSAIGKSASTRASGRAVPWIIDGVLVRVDDLDAHFQRALAAGARILSNIEEGPPGRRYRAGKYFEGHRWFFFEKEGE